MCGIAGQITFDGTPVVRQRIAAMGACLQHRGPDDAGVLVRGAVGLAHRRLSVLDLSPAGHQPMSNEDGTVWIVYNGEIYNFESLRAQLSDAHVFRSRTDTEVILHLYEEYGLECIPMLRGMFAFAIWDERERQLILARDRVGKKPLYYSVNPRDMTFASEVKALMVNGPPRDVDPVALDHYLTFQYVPAPWSIVAGVKKLRPGHLLVCKDGNVTERAYWTLSYRKQTSVRREEEYREEFLGLLQEATRLRLVSDVPLGAFLSGGMDSSAVVALMSRLTEGPVKTFSIGFKEDAFNELPYARQVAARYRTEHHEFIVEPSAIEILPRLARVYDEPFADSSAIPTYCVAQLSRQFVTVALNGDGGDELLGGYSRYHHLPVDTLIPFLAGEGLRKRALALIRRVAGGRAGAALLQNRLERLVQPFSHIYLGRICYFSPEEKKELYTSGFGGIVEKNDSLDLLTRWFAPNLGLDLLDQLLAVDTGSYLPDDLLVKVDRATMAHGLEARSPFLDHKLLEFCAALPVEYKIRGDEKKYLLKSVMREWLPSDILSRPKMGFGVPIDQWFRGPWKAFVEDTLLSARALQRGYFEPEHIRRLVKEQRQGRASYGSRVYALLMLELWHQEYVDGCDARRVGSEVEHAAV